jgi:hypothetical protein
LLKEKIKPGQENKEEYESETKITLNPDSELLMFTTQEEL